MKRVSVFETCGGGVWNCTAYSLAEAEADARRWHKAMLTDVCRPDDDDTVLYGYFSLANCRAGRADCAIYRGRLYIGQEAVAWLTVAAIDEATAARRAQTPGRIEPRERASRIIAALTPVA